jgi:acetyl esterase/lipase
MTEIDRITFAPTTDWNSAYDNRAAVGNEAVEAFVADITKKAAAFREKLAGSGRADLDLAYGDRPRQCFDLFKPEQSAPDGLAIFIHGGYWRTFDKSFWSHLAAGALARGFAVAMPSYTLCPEAKISQISAEMARFVTDVAARVEGPIHVAGHSAGGHLASRLAAGMLDRSVQSCIAKVMSISGVHDLRPLIRTGMNDDLHLDLAEARAESPLLLEPDDGIDLTCWVGGDELLAFRQQNRQLADVWGGLGAKTDAVEARGKHHFSVIEDLADSESGLVKTWLG